MPANLTPQYKEAEQRYRRATTPEEQEKALGQMLALIPKHKGTEKLQADLKRRLSELRKEKGKKKGGDRARPVWVIDAEGAGQVPVVGGPNAGKSAVIAALTGAPVQVAEYAYTTQKPRPAMMPFEDAQVQLIDTPPASEEFAPAWISEIVRRADVVILVANLVDPDSWVAADWIVGHLGQRGIELVPARVTRPGSGDDDGGPKPHSADRDDEDRGLAFRLPLLLVGTHADDPEAGVGREALAEVLPSGVPLLEYAPDDRERLERLRRAIFLALEVVRVYSKEPGKEAEKKRPWILHDGSTVHDLANHIHHDLADRFEFGRLWGSSRFEGQRVGEDYVLADRDVVEIHTR